MELVHRNPLISWMDHPVLDAESTVAATFAAEFEALTLDPWNTVIIQATLGTSAQDMFSERAHQVNSGTLGLLLLVFDSHPELNNHALAVCSEGNPLDSSMIMGMSHVKTNDAVCTNQTSIPRSVNCILTHIPKP